MTDIFAEITTAVVAHENREEEAELQTERFSRFPGTEGSRETNSPTD
jgi:hypothetical protein